MCYFMNLPYLVHSWPDISTEKNPPQEQKTTDQPQNMASSQERFKVKPVSTSLIEILRVTFHKKSLTTFWFSLVDECPDVTEILHWS